MVERSEIIRTVETVHNPALGAYAIWQFVLGYHRENKQSVPVELLFVVLPVVLNQDMRTIMLSTRAGILKCRAKLRKEADESAILRISETAPMLYGLSSKSISMALCCGLIRYNPEDSTFDPNRMGLPNKVKLSKVEGGCGKAASKLGKWVSSLSRAEIEFALGVRF